MKVPHDASLSFQGRAFSIDAWVRPLSHTSNDAFGNPLIDKRHVNGAGYGVGYGLWWTNDDRLAVRLGDGGGSDVAYISQAHIPVGYWTLVAVTINPTANLGLVYINGALDGSFIPSDTAAGSIDNGEPLFMALSQPTGAGFHGDLDEVEVFEKVMSPAEVQVIYDALSGGKCLPCQESAAIHRRLVAIRRKRRRSVGCQQRRVQGRRHHGRRQGRQGRCPQRNRRLRQAPRRRPGGRHRQLLDRRLGLPRPCRQHHPVIASKKDPNTGIGWQLSLRSGSVIFDMDDGINATLTYVSPTQFRQQDWTFVGVSVDRTMADGGLVSINHDTDGTFDASGVGSIQNTWPLTIGASGQFGQLFIGRIDEFEVSGSALTQDDFTQIYWADSAGKCTSVILLDANRDGLPDTVSQLEGEIPISDLPHGISNALTSKLDRVQAAYNRGNNAAGNNVLDAFSNQVRAQQGKKIPALDADLFLRMAQNIVTQHPS